MASQIFNAAKAGIMSGAIDLDTDNVYAALVMSNTTADTENSAIVYVGDLSTLDEADGANYVRKKLTTPAVSVDDVNVRGEFDADDITWTNLGVGTRTSVGLILYTDADDDGDAADDETNLIITYIEFSSPVTHDGSNFTVQWNSEGIIQGA